MVSPYSRINQGRAKFNGGAVIYQNPRFKTRAENVALDMWFIVFIRFNDQQRSPSETGSRQR